MSVRCFLIANWLLIKHIETINASLAQMLPRVLPNFLRTLICANFSFVFYSLHQYSMSEAMIIDWQDLAHI